MDTPDLRVEYVAAGAMSESMRAAKHALQVACFADVPADEIEEYFVAEAIGSVLAWEGAALVGCVSVHKRTITVAGEDIVLGGYGGTCTRADRRRQGIGAQVCAVAMEQLRREGCAVAVLAVGEDGATVPFYERQGYRLLGRPFEIVTASGTRVLPEGDLAMIAPVTSPDVLERIMAGEGPFFIGPEPGYW